jgi:hypothetical protein
MTEQERALWVRAEQEYRVALRAAAGAWSNDVVPIVTAEALQAAAATILLHHKYLAERGGVTPQPAPAAVKRDGPSPATSQAPRAGSGSIPNACPECGGPVWDNRDKKRNPKAPDWKCKNKTCVDDKGFVTAGWIPKAQAQAAAIRDGIDSFAEMPAALREEEESLPF